MTFGNNDISRMLSDADKTADRKVEEDDEEYHEEHNAVKLEDEIPDPSLEIVDYISSEI